MITTINISLPGKMHHDLTKYVSSAGYSSVSEFIRDAIRHRLYPSLTQNGLTEKFEEEIVKRERNPKEKIYRWNGKDSFTNFVLKEGKKTYGKVGKNTAQFLAIGPHKKVYGGNNFIP